MRVAPLLALLAALCGLLEARAALGAQGEEGRVVSAELVPARIDRAHVGSVRIRFTLSGRASVDVALDRQLPGSRVGTICVPRRPEFRGYPACELSIPMSKRELPDEGAGTHSLRLGAVLQGRTLAAGRYGVRVWATGQARALRVVLTVTT